MKKLWIKIKALISKEFALLKKHLEKGRVAVRIVNALKEAIDTPVADFLVNLTATDLDNRLLSKARIALPAILQRMAIAQAIIEQAKSNSDVVGAILEHLRKMLPEGRKAFYADLAAEINVCLADGDLSWSEGLGLAQKIYKEYL